MLIGTVQHLQAVAVYVDWTSFTPSSSSGAGDGSAIGTLTFGPTVVNVSYSGDVYSGGGVTTTVNDDVAYYSTPNYTPPIALTDNISNDDGANNVHTIAFDLPVVNPHFHVFSLGAPGTPVDWVFDSDFAVLSGNISRSSANTLSGEESYGSIGFTGVFTSISWTTPIFENTTGFQFSVDDVAPPPPPANGVPEGGPTIAVFGISLLVLVTSRARACPTAKS
ncbi:MAG TPA: hypothetical protein VJ719_11310 [Chthoniobacterales bacterium]|nr:hypothetical protein [Chthoniobacterales bacterium]